MNSGQSWREIIRRETNQFVLIAVRMVRAALVVILFVLLEGVIMAVMEVVLVLPRSERLRPRMESIIDEVAVWSVIGVIVFYAFYVIGEISRQFLRTVRGE